MAAREQSVSRINYPVGIAIGALGGLALSTGGLLLRSIDSATGWQILIYRSASFTLLVLLILTVRYRGRLVRPFLQIG